MSQENVEIVRRSLRAFSEDNLGGVLDLWADDGEWRPAILGGGLLEGAVYKGHNGVREFFRVQRETWATVSAEPVASRDLGDLVLVEVRLDAVGRASGASVNQTTWNVFEVVDGRSERGGFSPTKAPPSKLPG